MTEALQELCRHLAAAKQTRSAEGAPFTFADVEPAVRILVEEHAAELPRRISGSKVTKRDGQHETEVLKNFFRLVRELDRQYRYEMEELRKAAGAKVKTVYLPASALNPEQ
jgi:hypothetical protein